MSDKSTKNEKIKRNWWKPRWWYLTAIPHLIDKQQSVVEKWMMKPFFAHYPWDYCNFLDEDWDNLLILDACRYDMFADMITLDGTLQHRYSNASATASFLENTFADRECFDTVYVTANPMHSTYETNDHLSISVADRLHAVVDVWKTDWDDDLNTVRPEAVVRAAKMAAEEYPNKRLIVHFIQPHQPFIGEFGKTIDEPGMRGRERYYGKELENGEKVWKQLENSDISKETVWKAYRENLELVLPHTRELHETLSGKTVVTSDHGNMVGEFAWPFPIRQYGHPNHLYTKTLIKVPWFAFPYDTRKRIIAEEPFNGSNESPDTDIHEKLQALGYA